MAGRLCKESKERHNTSEEMPNFWSSYSAFDIEINCIRASLQRPDQSLLEDIVLATISERFQHIRKKVKDTRRKVITAVELDEISHMDKFARNSR